MSLLSVKSQSSKSKRKKKRIRVQGVYVWGSGAHGQLGIGEEVDRKIPTFLDLFRDDKKSGEFNTKKDNATPDQRKKKGRMICVSCGGGHSAVVKALIDGKTSVCVEGRNNYGQLGLPDKGLDIVNIPTVVASLNDIKIRQVACGGGHTIALTDEGDVYTWGWSIYGQLGLGKERDETLDKRSIPTLVPYFRENGIKIKLISAGGGHSAFVDGLGKVYVCGMNNTGQLGLGDTEPRYEPKLVTVLQDIRIEKIVCGEAHTAAVDDHGLLYTWGCGELFRLGHLTEDNELSPRVVQYFVDEVLEIKDVACGLSHTIAVTASGLVYSWGSNKFGELGIGNLYSKKTPTLIEDFPGPVRVVRAGHGFSAAINDIGQLYMWGNGSNGKLGSGSESNEKFPKKLSALSDICVLDVKLGASHVLAYADTGSNDRNRSILKIYSAEKNFLAHMSLVCNIISPVAASVVGEENWRIIMGNYHSLYEYHRTKILLPVEQRLSKLHKELRFASIFKKAFEDPLFLKMQTEYSLNFAKGWQRFLECLKAISELGTFLKECFSSEEFARTGLVKIYRGAEQYNAFLELPLIYFNEIMPIFQDALDRTKKDRDEYKDLVEVIRTLRQIADLSSNSISNTKFVKFLEFLKQFPEHQYLFEAHRRYVNSFGFVTNEKEEKPSHSLVLFNDLIAIVNQRSEKKELENLMFLQSVFLKDVKSTTKPCFMIGTQNASYNMFFDGAETKDTAFVLLHETIRQWVDNHPRAKESRIKSGIELVVSDLQQVLPLIHKDWIQEVEELQTSGITTGEDLQKINKLFTRTAQTLEYENAKKQKMLTANLSHEGQAPEMFYTSFVMAQFSSRRKASSSFNYKAYAKYKKQSVDFSSGDKKDVSTRSSDYSTESIIQRNHCVRMRFTGNQTVSEVKREFYNTIKESPWAEFCELGPIDQYELKIKGIEYRITNESLMLNRIPIVQMILTSAFVTPFLELVPKSKTTNSKLEFDSEMKLFDDLSAILGELKPFFNSTNIEEMTAFRRSIARQRTKQKSPLEAAVETSGGIAQAIASTLNTSQPMSLPNLTKATTDGADVVNISASLFDRLEIPEAWKGLEAAPLAWPATFTINILTVTGEKITLEVQPTASINKVRDDAFTFLYKKEKHKRKVHLPKFVKDLAQKAGNLTESREGSATPADPDALNENGDNNSNMNNSNTATSATDNSDSSSMLETSLSISSDEEAMEEIESATVEATTNENNGPAESDSDAEELDMKHQILTNEAIAERLTSITQGVTSDDEVAGGKEGEPAHRHEHKKSRDKNTEVKERIDKKPRSSPKLGRKFPAAGEPRTGNTAEKPSSDSLRNSISREPGKSDSTPTKEKITGPANRKKLKTKTHSTVLNEIENLIAAGEGTEEGEREGDNGPDSQRTVDDTVHGEYFRKKKKSSKEMLPPVGPLKKKGSMFKEHKKEADKEKREEKKQRKEKEREEKKQRKVKEREEKRQRKQEKLQRKKNREKLGHTKKTHVKKLSNGLTVSDFILKVYGANEYLVGDNSIGSYDFIRKCVKQGTPINLKLLSASTLARSSTQETENYVTDRAIAEELLDEDIMLNNTSPVNISTMTPTSTCYAPRSFSDLADFAVPFKVKVLDCENLVIDPDLSKKMTIFVALGIHQMGMKKAPFKITSRAMYANNPIWNEDISFEIPTSQLTRESRLLVALYGRTDSSNTSNEVLLSDIPLAWLNINLFTNNSCSRAGLVGLKLWEQKVVRQAHPDVITGENRVSPSAPLLFLELFSVSSEDEREGMFTFRKRKRSKNKLKVKAITKSESTKEPSMEEILYLKQIIARDSLEKFKNDAERDIIFHHRRWCRDHPDSLPWLLRSVDWSNREAVSHMHKALDSWPLIDPFKAIELLDNRFTDLTVRSYAVRCLQRLSDVDLYKILLQLVQALKFEPHHSSDLAQFLLERALRDKNRIGFRLFWLLKSELHVPYLIERFGLILEAYLRSCGKEYRQELLNQHKVFIEQLYHIATEIRKETRHKQRKIKLQQLLKSYEWPARFLLPLDPRVECSGFIMEKCRVLGSKTVPLFLAFKNAETGEAVNVIYKVGDDLRQDVLTLQIIGLMDSMWKQDGLDLRLKPYGCLALGNEFGLIEVVPHAHTTSNINIELGGVRAVYSRETLSKWLRTQNPTEAAWRKAVETFMASCAGYTVLTFALGLADRHNDNIMLTKDGNLFHIDFGHFLGHYRKIMGSFYADKADLVFIDQYYHIIGKEHYGRFKDICCRAYNIVRAHANIFIDMLSLMLASGLPELTSKKDVAFVKERLRLDLTPEEAAEYFKHKLEENRDAKTILFNHAFHVMYHGMKNN